MLQHTLKTAFFLIAIAVAATFFLDQKLVPPDPRSQVANLVPASNPVIGQSVPAAKVSVPIQTSYTRGTEILQSDVQGHFQAMIEVNGTPIQTLVDTGATLVVFGAQDAERAGIRPMPSEFKYKSRTANGEVAMAMVKLRNIRLGSIELNNIDAAVLPEGAMQGTLLGMSFLRQLQVQTDGGKLILRQ